MNRGQSTLQALTIFACICLLIFTESMVKPAFGGQRTTKEQASPAIAGKAVRPVSEQSRQSASKIVSSTGLQRAKAVQKPPKQSPSTQLKPMPSKGRLQVKVRKKVIPKAVVQSRTDLIHYGMLEDSQRYDPRPHTDSAAVRSPQTPELTHDHFQELDRNQDGMIDPVERALGRIDMDRDLHSRTLQ
jgi:hypothetical protein